MTETIILIDHPVGKRDDRASRMLAERGYRWAGARPPPPPPPPQPRSDHAAALVYGGAEVLSRSDHLDYLQAEVDWIARWAEADRPFLGICLGAQLLARSLGGRVAPHPEGLHEIGYVEITPTSGADGFLHESLHVYHWHKEGFEVPGDAQLLATGEAFPNQAFRFGSTVYGLQFHPEVTPQVSQRWITEAGHMLAEPGAHSADRQIADSERYDGPMASWFERFLDVWLGDGPSR